MKRALRVQDRLEPLTITMSSTGEQEPKTEEQGEEWDDAFGVCPVCRRHDGYLNWGPDHWFWCREHKTAWFFGSNLLSSWRFETEAQWDEYRRILRTCQITGVDRQYAIDSGLLPQRPAKDGSRNPVVAGEITRCDGTRILPPDYKFQITGNTIDLAAMQHAAAIKSGLDIEQLSRQDVSSTSMTGKRACPNGDPQFQAQFNEFVKAFYEEICERYDVAGEPLSLSITDGVCIAAKAALYDLSSLGWLMLSEAIFMRFGWQEEIPNCEQVDSYTCGFNELLEAKIAPVEPRKVAALWDSGLNTVISSEIRDRDPFVDDGYEG